MSEIFDDLAAAEFAQFTSSYSQRPPPSGTNADSKRLKSAYLKRLTINKILIL
jgi:hypothetical protein